MPAALNRKLNRPGYTSAMEKAVHLPKREAASR